MTATTDGELGLAARAGRLRSSVIRDLLRLTERPDVISLAGGLPAPELFPLTEIAAAAARLDPSALQYARTEGTAALRELVAADASAARDRTVGVDEVLVTAGSQQGLDLIASVVCDDGDLVAVDDPAYLGALQAFERAGARFLPVPVDADGLDVDALESHLDAGHRITCCYTVTEHGNPSGATLSPARRVKLAALAERFGFLVIEDSPYRLLAFDGTPPPHPVGRWTDRALSLGSTSKTVAPGLRVGWVVGPPGIVRVLALAKQAADLHTSTLSQHLVVDLLERPGWLDSHVRRVAGHYGARCEALVRALTERFGARVAFDLPTGGMFVWARLRGVDTTSLLDVAVDDGVAFVPGSAFAAPGAGVSGRHDDALRLSFATVPPDRLRDAVARLAAAVARVDGPIRG